MNALLSLAISIASFIGLYNYLPLDLVTLNTRTPSFGATITTIQGSDTLSASRSVINTNFANLNSDKIENSTTSVKSITTLPSLSSIGTIATGVWNGTAVTVPYGGTGSTTLGSNLILLGNGTSNVKTVTGLGSSGEVLMSNGAGSAPSWQSSSVNQTLPYTWTAHHIFSSLFATSASTTNATTSNLYVSGTPSGNIANTASTSVWTADGTWTKPPNAKMVFIQLWGGGGSGGVGQQAGTGGGGGEYREWWIPAASLGSTVTVTVGTGGTAVSTSGNSNGNTGNDTTFGSHLTAKGGGAGQGSASGADLTGGAGGRPFATEPSLWGNSETTDLLKDGIYSAAGGYYDHTVNVFAGGSSYWGGAGGGTGGGSPASASSGGTSTHGGNGGAGATGAGPTATSGSAPGGGGGGTRISSGTGTSGAGGLGRAIITTIY